MEQWKPIKGYDHYDISNLGRVKSLERIAHTPLASYLKPENILKAADNGKGYKFVRLWQDGKSKKHYIHRLVAEAFIPNPNNYPEVNHIDSDPSNNKVDNLEWVTHRQNAKHMMSQGRGAMCRKEHKKRIAEINKKQRKAVIGKSVATGEEIRFPYLNATKERGFDTSSVSECCNGYRKNHKGYTWRFAEERYEKEWLKNQS